MLFSLSGCACVAHVLRVRSATHARLSRFSAFALRLLVSCCCQAVARCSRTSCTLRSSFSSFSAFAVCSLASHLFASKKAVFKTYNQAQLRLCFFLCQAVRVLLTYFVYVLRLVLVFLDLCALIRVWSMFDKRYSAAFRDFQRLLCARLSLCFKHAPLLVLVFLGFCRLLFGKSPLCKQKSSVQDVQQKHGDLPCFLI